MIHHYAELRCKTNFSFLCGASHADELAVRAAGLGYAARAVTDLNTLAGIVRAHAAAKAVGLKLLIGAEITPEDAPAVLLYAPDIRAYGRLSTLITRGRRAAEKGKCHLVFNDIAEHAEGLLAAEVPDLVFTFSARGPSAKRKHESLAPYRDLFPGRGYPAGAVPHGTT